MLYLLSVINIYWTPKLICYRCQYRIIHYLKFATNLALSSLKSKYFLLYYKNTTKCYNCNKNKIDLTIVINGCFLFLHKTNNTMNVHEYQAKEILSSFGVRIQRGKVAHSTNNALTVAHELSEEQEEDQRHADGLEHSPCDA